MNDYPWYFENIIRKINNAASFTETAVTSLDDIPSLVKALEDFGQFQTAEIMEEWYFDMKGRVRFEHNAYATTS